MSENISIRITDDVDPAISKKIQGIAKEATAAHSGITKLQSALKGISASSGLQKLQTELAKTGLAQQKLVTEINKTNAAYFNSEAALNRAIAAEVKAATATAQLASAQNNSAIAAQRLAAAQSQTATASAQAATAAINTATAQTKAATAQTQSQTAAQGLAAATTKTTTAQTQGQLVAARLAAAQTATGTATSNAAAAQDRAALAALRLSQAQAKAAQATQGGASALWNYAKAGAAVLGVGFSAKVIIDIGDAYTILQNKLQNVTDSQAQVNTLTKELFGLANKTRSGVEETATAYVRFDRALKILGKSQEETLRLTETVNKALINGGAAPQEAASALLQLSQGFNAGRLMGDEFRAVAENMPVVLDAVAKALGAPINSVKQLASEGKITSAVLFKAFKLIEAQTDATFAKSMPTVGQAMTVAKNKAIEFFGELNKSVGFTAGLAKGILFLSDHIAILSAGLAVLGSALLVAFGPAIVAAIGAVGSAIAAFTVAIATNPIGLIIVGITAAIALFVLFADKIKLSSDGLVSLQDVASAVWSYIANAAEIAITFIYEGWKLLSNFIGEKTKGWGEIFVNAGSEIITAVKNTVNAFITPWVFAFNFVSELWKAGPKNFATVFSEIGNIAKDAAGKDYLGDLGKSIAGGFENATKSIMDRAREIAKARELAQGDKAKLRGNGPDLSGGTAGKFNAGRSIDARAGIENAERQNKAILEKDRELKEQRLQITREVDFLILESQAESIDKQKALVEFGAKSKLEDLQRSFEFELLSYEQQNSAIAAIEQDKLNKIKAINQEVSQARLNAVADFAGGIGTMVGGFLAIENANKAARIAQLEQAGASKAQIDAAKKSASQASALAKTLQKIAIFETVVSTYAGAAKALNSPLPPPIPQLDAAGRVAAGLGHLAMIKAQGFQDGGWTGNKAVNEVAGVVHGKEYVIDAQTTSRVGVQNLAALQSGAASVQRNGSGTAQASNSGVTHNGDVIIPINMPAGTSKADAETVGAAVADGYMRQMRKQERLRKEGGFHGVVKQ